MELGQGAHGMVFLGCLSGMDVAIKVLFARSCSSHISSNPESVLINVWAPLKSVCMQAVELQPGVASGAFWREATIQQRCIHARIVPLYGVAIRVRWTAC